MESVYWLPGKTRLKIVEMLVKNNGILYQYAANNEVISNMMIQNKHLIDKLSGLLARPVENVVSSDSIRSVSDARFVEDAPADEAPAKNEGGNDRSGNLLFNFTLRKILISIRRRGGRLTLVLLLPQSAPHKLSQQT